VTFSWSPNETVTSKELLTSSLENPEAGTWIGVLVTVPDPLTLLLHPAAIRKSPPRRTRNARLAADRLIAGLSIADFAGWHVRSDEARWVDQAQGSTTRPRGVSKK
jgi:hypothetical protein